MTKTLKDLADDLRGIDICMLATRTDDGQITSRPMSNNGDAEYDGDSFYFTRATSRVVHEIQSDPKVSLAFSTAPGLLTGAGLYICVEGEAEVIRDKARFEAHWSPDLDIWFDQGIDTPGVVMLKVHAEKIRYWAGADQGQIVV
ncbi:MAG: pyridoxamine 5'-phosphate oxidase family protein [Hyphomicrobium sp.]|jgi:general stress protein 26|uniref:pyridoxamine 5'-phosphate oxidase family protein n=1 Tax=Hyphomicrobium sp. TaxID=82 RepID=UPI0025C3D8B0|nr:pyridoxamine 5'-phosphate oxidase family protein [Hyphomicrobium sp.]MBX9862502.1 pyridoxamine 5'-phosphate oxidase family protein [Hyphomicrobium sp.]